MKYHLIMLLKAFFFAMITLNIGHFIIFGSWFTGDHLRLALICSFWFVFGVLCKRFFREE